MRIHMWDFQPPDKLLSEDLHPPNFHLIRFLCSCKCGIIVMWLYLCSTSFLVIIIWASQHNSQWKWITPPAPVLPKGSLELRPQIVPLQSVWVLVFHKVGPGFDQFFALLSLLTEATLDLLKLLSSFPFSMSIIITDTDDLMTHDGESTCPPPKSLQRSAKHEGEFWPISSVMIPDQYQRDREIPKVGTQ